ncbi:hypothetical protein XENOCAPTIV_027502 [Xenoophorus captivus]|uniref:Uncharacterized protein n=1 Tax=Xenoophorus captivus TaxID=1517983 RepID=A0ABV0QXU9_9TELE
MLLAGWWESMAKHCIPAVFPSCSSAHIHIMIQHIVQLQYEHIPLGGDPELSGGTVYLFWPGKASGFTRRSWRETQLDLFTSVTQSQKVKQNQQLFVFLVGLSCVD